MMPTTWQQFARFRSGKCGSLLSQLNNYPKPILVSGCQRSGTTMLTKLLLSNQQIVDYRTETDSELRGALILAGLIPHHDPGRYCFQTTYLNECVAEYGKITTDFHLIWLIRNPYSVIHSLLHNWQAYALDELFAACGKQVAPLAAKFTDKISGLSPFKKACYAYVGKTSQLVGLQSHLPPQRLTILDYDHLVANKTMVLEQLYQRLGLITRPGQANPIHNHSHKKSTNLPPQQQQFITQTCRPLYQKLLSKKTF